MNRDYWESIAADYQRAVLSVFDQDAEGLVRERIAAAGAASPEGRAADLGCGVGRFTPLLAEAFAQVEACDFSERALEIARERCAGAANVTFRHLDLATDPAPFEPVDFVLCVNVLIMPALDERLRAWRMVTNQVASGGALLLVVPSLESAQMAFYRDVDARLDDGETCADALRLSESAGATAAELQQGVRRLGAQRTKHYLRAELEEMLPAHELDAFELRELAYPPDLDGVPPGSWDWLALARRR